LPALFFFFLTMQIVQSAISSVLTNFVSSSLDTSQYHKCTRRGLCVRFPSLLTFALIRHFVYRSEVAVVVELTCTRWRNTQILFRVESDLQWWHWKLVPANKFVVSFGVTDEMFLSGRNSPPIDRFWCLMGAQDVRKCCTKHENCRTAFVMVTALVDSARQEQLWTQWTKCF
jgi:hypothetical protein